MKIFILFWLFCSVVSIVWLVTNMARTKGYLILGELLQMIMFSLLGPVSLIAALWFWSEEYKYKIIWRKK